MKLTESINICDVSIAGTIKISWERWFPANVYLVNGLQSENKRPINWQIKYFFGEGRIPATLGNPEPILSKVDIAKFGNSSSFDIWTFWLLVIIWSMSRGLWHNWKVNDNVKQSDESLIGQCEHNTFETPWDKLQNLFGMKFATDVILLFLSVADNDIFVYFFVSQVWTMKLSESTNTCHFNNRFARTIKENIKEMVKHGFLKILL